MNLKNILLIPSLLAFDKHDWVKDIPTLINHHFHLIHFDVMDYEYVHNTAYNHKDYNDLLNIDNSLKANIHLMVTDPLKHIPHYLKPNTNGITFHFDVYQDHPSKIYEALNLIKRHGIKPGIAVSPNFCLDDYKQYLKDCQIVTIMGVYPGKGGQKFIDSTLQNLYDLAKYNEENQLGIEIEVDGGMNFETVPHVCNHSRYIVAGSFLKNHIHELEKILNWFNSL